MDRLVAKDAAPDRHFLPEQGIHKTRQRAVVTYVSEGLGLRENLGVKIKVLGHAPAGATARFGPGLFANRVHKTNRAHIQAHEQRKLDSAQTCAQRLPLKMAEKNFYSAQELTLGKGRINVSLNRVVKERGLQAIRLLGYEPSEFLEKCLEQTWECVQDPARQPGDLVVFKFRDRQSEKLAERVGFEPTVGI